MPFFPMLPGPDRNIRVASFEENLVKLRPGQMPGGERELEPQCASTSGGQDKNKYCPQAGELAISYVPGLAREMAPPVTVLFMPEVF